MGLVTAAAIHTPNTHIPFLKRFVKGFLRYTETVGRARAAAELTRQGYNEEAKRLMLGKDL